MAAVIVAAPEVVPAMGAPAAADADGAEVETPVCPMQRDPTLSVGVLKFLPIEQQLACLLRVSRTFWEMFRADDPNSEYWSELCRNFCSERLLWLPTAHEELQLLTASRGGSRGLLREFWPLRTRFASSASAEGAPAVIAPAESFKLQTYCRFRPAPEGGAGAAAVGASAMPLPLHQRVALLKRSHPELSHKEAVKLVLAGQRAKAEHAEAEGDGPSAAHGGDGFTASVLNVQPGTGGSVLTVLPGCGLRSFEFGRVFDSASTQEEVYRHCGLQLVADVVNGVNGALVLYGQTGSGKTHTMFGPPEADEKTAGLALRVADALLAAAVERRKLGLEVLVGLSYVEVFGNEVTDLLREAAGEENRSTNARIGHRLLIDGGLEVAVKERTHLLELLARGDGRKRCASTSMNERSTRAHTILVFHLKQALAGSEEPPVSSQLFLADLGGSERVTKSHANADAKSAGYVPWNEYYLSRQRLCETNYINQGLLSLKRCIRALDERQQRVAAGRRPVPVPFRDSKLTAVLEPALGGAARAAVVVCCSPEGCHAEETVQTLRFGEMCSRIEHVQKASADPSSAVARALRELDEDIGKVEELIRQKERWEWREQVRTDVVDASIRATARVNTAEEMELGGYGAVEILQDDGSIPEKEVVEHPVRGQVLVGAEEERERLEALLEKRRRLLGEA